MVRYQAAPLPDAHPIQQWGGPNPEALRMGRLLVKMIQDNLVPNLVLDLWDYFRNPVLDWDLRRSVSPWGSRGRGFKSRRSDV